MSTVPAVLDASEPTKLVEAWRMTGFVVFAGLFALLAHRPHALPGVFELVIAHKAVMTVIAASSGDGATEVALGDGW